MSRFIEITTTFTLRVDDTLSAESLAAHVHNGLRHGFGEDVPDSAASHHIVCVHDRDGPLHRAPWIHHLLDDFGQAAVVWSVGDILDVRPDLTSEQAASVLYAAIHEHDASHGIGWDTFEWHAAEMFGPPPAVGGACADN